MAAAAAVVVACTMVGLWGFPRPDSGDAEVAGDLGPSPDSPAPAPGPPAPSVPAPAPAEPAEPPPVRAAEAAQLATGCRIEPVGQAAYRVVAPRRVELDRGDLYVEIDRRHSGDEPFVVVTPAGEAKAIGTRFVVETRSVEAEPSEARQKPVRTESPVSAALSKAQFLTKVLVLAGIVHLVNSEGQVEGRAGEVIKTEAAQVEHTPPVAVQAVTIRTVPGALAMHAGAAPKLAQPTPSYSSLPGYWMLQQEPVRKEIGLTPQQEAKLQEIARQYQERMQKVYAPLQNKGLTAEDRAKLYKEMSAKFQELQRWVGQQVKESLLPQQTAALEKIDLRMKAASYLQAPAVLERLGLSDQQKEKVKKNRSDLADKVYRLQKDSFEEVVKILTPEQLEKLKQPWGASQPGGVAPAKK